MKKMLMTLTMFTLVAANCSHAMKYSVEKGKVIIKKIINKEGEEKVLDGEEAKEVERQMRSVLKRAFYTLKSRELADLYFCAFDEGINNKVAIKPEQGTKEEERREERDFVGTVFFTDSGDSFTLRINTREYKIYDFKVMKDAEKILTPLVLVLDMLGKKLTDSAILSAMLKLKLGKEIPKIELLGKSILDFLRGFERKSNRSKYFERL